MNELRDSLKNLMLLIKGNDSKKKIVILKDFVIYIFILCFLKTPLVLLRDLSVDYFNDMNPQNNLGTIFYWLYEFLYILFIILMIRNWLIKKFSTNNND